MGLKMQLRVSWGLVNLYVCAIAVGLTIPGSSGSGSPVSMETSSVAPTQATAVTPEPGPLLNGPTIQPPSIYLPLGSAPPLPAETPQQQQHVSLTTPPPASEPPQVSTPPLDTKPPEAVAPMPIVDPPPQPLPLPSPPPESKPASSPQTPDVALPPLTVPLPLNPQPLPSPIIPPVPPQASPTTSSAPPPLELPPMSPPPSSTLPGVATPPYVSSPPPLMMSPPSPPPSTIPSQTPPPLMISPPSPPPSTIPSQTPPPLMMSPPAPPPSTIPSQTPPPLVSSPPPSTIPGVASPPYASSPPPLLMSPPAPPPSSIPSHTPYAPPPLEESPSSVPPSPTMQAASPPRGSPKEEVHSRASPPVQDSPEPPPTSSVAPLSAPPLRQATLEANPPMSHQMGAPAPKHSAPSVVKTNVSVPHSPPLPAQVPTMAPPRKAPVELSPAVHPSPHHEAHHNRTPSEPKFERHNETAPAPFSLPKPPPSGRSHLSPRHSPVNGSPMVEVPPPSASETPEISPTPSTVGRRHSSRHSNITLLSPRFSPPGSSGRNATKQVGLSMQALPPPPPNQDCGYLTCPAPFTNTPTGSPCGCVWPMQVGLRLSMALYTFFPLVSELAKEIAVGVSMKPGQVRVMGAESGTQDPDKIIVLVDLVPFHEKFDDTTASLAFQRFWHKQVHLDKSIFGDYDVLYVHYPGLPPSPPLASADAAVVNSMPYSVVDNNGSTLHPLGVMLPQRQNHRLNASLIAVIVFSAIVGVMISFSVVWLLILRYRNRDSQPAPSVLTKHSLGRSSGPTGHSTGSGQSSFSAGSSLGKYPGSAKTFTTGEMEKATDNFNPSRILGEGGFGCVYSGTLEDGTNVAVKVLKRDDKQGGREFLAEIEMLNRVHHRNLVKLIGICVDDSMRCLVYELVPNGSVESHLHGADKEAAPLDWSARLKIALGAARGLAYLHEDSSPGVIHRDFKSSNILLEDDFTPKVSDFGLARFAMNEENRHISTQIMGTFGYVAPEYAMTGHLLAKSDVYSYGVVLLELLTGRRPIDMLQPPGEENLVAWARPHLTNKQGLESIIDPSLLSSDDMSTNLESVAKVAAIASMCVQPEVSHRPFMGEVVQALKLVSNEEENASKDDDDNNCSGSPKNMSSLGFDAKMALLLDDVEKGSSPGKGALSMSGGFEKKKSSPFRRISSSGPMRNAKGEGSKLWEGIRKWSHGSRSEHGTMYRLWPGSH